MTRKTKLKSILEAQIFQSTNTAKLDKLSRDKWSGLKKVMGKRPFLVSFFDQGKKIFQARRSRVRASFLIRQDLIRRLKINSVKLKTSQNLCGSHEGQIVSKYLPKSARSTKKRNLGEW